MDVYTIWKENPLFNERVLHHLLSNYQQQHRKYHTIQHIQECFEEFNSIKKLLHHPEQVELAIWFHDAIYNPARQDNEEKSARMLANYSPTKTKKGMLHTQQAQRLILATKDHEAYDHDSAYFLDIDMSILGSSPKRFNEYEQQIREEYSMYSDEEYKQGRSTFLKPLSTKYKIYNTEEYEFKYAKQAKLNIDRTLLKLS